MKRRPRSKGSTRRYKWEIQVEAGPNLSSHEGLFRKRDALREARIKARRPDLAIRVVNVEDGQIIFRRDRLTMSQILKRLDSPPGPWFH